MKITHHARNKRYKVRAWKQNYSSARLVIGKQAADVLTAKLKEEETPFTIGTANLGGKDAYLITTKTPSVYSETFGHGISIPEFKKEKIKK